MHELLAAGVKQTNKRSIYILNVILNMKHFQLFSC